MFTPAQLASLPKFRVVVWRSSMAPVLGRVDRFWVRGEYREQIAAIKQAERDVLADAADTTRGARPVRTGLACAVRRRREQRLLGAAQHRGRDEL